MKPALLFNYDYAMTPFSYRQPWSPAFQLQEALREYFDVYRRDEINLSSADFVFNASIERRTFTFGNVRPILVHMNRDYMSVGDPYLDYIPYTDEASLISQIDYYLANDKEREQIGNNMILNLKENHTNQIRAKTVYQAFCAL